VLLAVDIGTSVFKSAIWDFGGNRAAFASSPLAIDLSDGTRHETDSGRWLRAFESCCQALGAKAPLGAIEAIVVCGNGPSLAPAFGGPFADAGAGAGSASHSFARSVPAAPARLWLDRRAEEAARRVSAVMGGFVDAGFFLPKALDIMLNEPRLYEKAKVFLGCPELLAFALTGEARTVFPSDGFERWFWTGEALALLGLDAEKFPPFIRPGEAFGALSPGAAALFGFSPGIPVISGGADFIAAILGSGAIRPGQACNRAGTSDGINACAAVRISDDRLMSYGHPVKPFWNLSGIVSTTGKAIEWARALLGAESLDAFFALAQSAQAGGGGGGRVPALPRGRAGADLGSVRARGASRAGAFHGPRRDRAGNAGRHQLRNPRHR